MTRALLILVLVLAFVPVPATASKDGCPLTHITVAPEGIQAGHYCYWEEQFFVMLARNWHGNMATQTYSKTDAMLMDRGFVFNMRERFEKRGWDIRFDFSDSGIKDYGVTVNISRLPEMQMVFKDIAKGSYCSHVKEAAYVIKSTEEFAKVWEKFGANMVTPEIDFSKDMVIAVFAGQFNTGGYSVTIEKITETKNGFTIFIKTTSPPKDSPVTMALSQPYHMVVCPKIDKPVRYSWTE